MNTIPCLIRSSNAAGEVRFALGDPLVDSYLEFVGGRSRPNTLRAVAHDLKTFFGVVGKDPAKVVTADIFGFIAAQRGDGTVVRISDRESGLSARTIARRLSSISGLYAYLVARGDTPIASNPVPRGLSTRRWGGKRREVPLVRVPRTLPKILSPGEVTGLLGALRTHRDRAMVHAMVLGGLRRCKVLGLCLGDIQVPERSLFVAEGKGGHQRVIPISNTFFASVGDYLRHERPRDCETDRVFVTLKGPNRGKAMTPDGSTRSSRLPGPVQGWNERRAISCATPA
jgi:integrase/recombinase XerD